MLEVTIVVIYAITVLVIVARIDRPAKKGPRITGRGGDFE
jgi:hypothetical protein